MLYSTITKQPIHIPTNKELSDNMKRMTIEKLEYLDHKHDKFFRLDERARIIIQ